MVMHLQPVFVLCSAFLLSTATASAFAKSVVAQERQVPDRQSEQRQPPIPQVLFKPSGGSPLPTTRGAGSRSDRQCPQDELTNPNDSATQFLAFTALVSRIPIVDWGLTQPSKKWQSSLVQAGKTAPKAL